MDERMSYRLAIAVLVLAVLFMGYRSFGRESGLRTARDEAAQLSRELSHAEGIIGSLSDSLEEAQGELRSARNSLATAQAIGERIDEVFESGDDILEQFRRSIAEIESLLVAIGVIAGPGD